MNTIKTKVKEIVRSHPSGLRIKFEEKVFNLKDIITNDLRCDQEFYISDKVKDVYTLSLVGDGIADTSIFKPGTEFQTISIRVEE